jgi:hypothetical protein
VLTYIVPFITAIIDMKFAVFLFYFVAVFSSHAEGTFKPLGLLMQHGEKL